MFCENEECCECHKEIPVISFGASDISEGCQFIKCKGRRTPSSSEGRKSEPDASLHPENS
jgi:hypothetical protein